MSAKIAKALHEVMTKVGYVQKTKKSPIGYKYAGESAVLESLRPAMVEAGLLLLPCVTKLSDVDEYGNTHVIVEYTLAHKDGDIWPHKLAMAGTGNDKNKAGVSDKGVYKAITGANKYLLFKLFQIETGDDPERDAAHPDNDAAHDESREKFLSVTRAVIGTATDERSLLEWWNSEEQKNLRRDFELTKTEVDALVALVTKRRDELKQKVAA